jgi:dihydrofolate reductase
MRKLVMWNLITLDGYFEGRKSWEIDWHEQVWGPELEQLSLEQLKSIGALIFGRVTYEGMAGYWTTAKGEVADFMNSLPKIVCSRTLAEATWNNTTLVKGNVIEEISRLKKEQGKDLYVFGSANLSSTFTEHGLFDEYRVCLTPLILGGGTPLFKQNSERVKLKLIDAKTLKSGCVILRYQPEVSRK